MIAACRGLKAAPRGTKHIFLILASARRFVRFLLPQDVCELWWLKPFLRILSVCLDGVWGIIFMLRERAVLLEAAATSSLPRHSQLWPSPALLRNRLWLVLRAHYTLDVVAGALAAFLTVEVAGRSSPALDAWLQRDGGELVLLC